MLGDDDWLEKFIENYKVKLAQEKLELFSDTTKRKEVGSLFKLYTNMLNFNRQDCQCPNPLFVCDLLFANVHLSVTTCSPTHSKDNHKQLCYAYLLLLLPSVNHSSVKSYTC